MSLAGKQGMKVTAVEGGWNRDKLTLIKRAGIGKRDRWKENSIAVLVETFETNSNDDLIA